MSVFSQEKPESVPMNRNGSAQFKGTVFGDPARSESKTRSISKAPKKVEIKEEKSMNHNKSYMSKLYMKEDTILKNDTIKINLQQ